MLRYVSQDTGTARRFDVMFSSQICPCLLFRFIGLTFPFVSLFPLVLLLGFFDINT